MAKPGTVAHNLASYAPGNIVFTAQWMGDELRETFYVRDSDRPCRYPENVHIRRYGVVQGDPKAQHVGEIRYVRLVFPPCGDPGEADGRTPCIPLEKSIFYPLVKDRI